MATDPRIPLQFQGFDVGQIMDRAQQYQQQHYEMGRKKAADQREDEFRTALGDILTGNGSFHTPPIVADHPAPTNAGAAATQIGLDPKLVDPRLRAMRADPEGYLKFRGQQTQLTAGQLKIHKDLNDVGMQILGGVYDDASLARAKAVAHNLYVENGIDPSVIDNLPSQYSPELVKSLQMQGMDTAHQLHQIAVENKINWDQYDDTQDNERADRAQQDLSQYRGESLDVRRRGQDMTDTRVRRGQDLRGGRSGGGAPKTDNAVYADIANRWLQGQPISPRETRFAKEYEARHTPKGRGVSAGNGAVIVNPKTGQRMTLQNGQWVPIK